MASRSIQNNFSGGCLSPSLFGRSDLQAYYKGFASAENFVVAKEGSLRKRHGIVSTGITVDDANTKIVPYRFDRTTGCFITLVVSEGNLVATLYSKSGDSLSTTTIGGFSGSIKAIQSKQIGDQVWITNGAFYRIIIVTDGTTLSSRAWNNAQKPSPPTSVTAHGYGSGGSGSSRRIYYAAYIVKDGVMSDPAKDDIVWAASWVAGTYIDVKVNYDSSQVFDYILLCKRIGGSYGEVARWYPEDLEDTEATFRDENISAGEAVYAQTNTLGAGWGNPLCVDCFQQRRVFANASNNDGGYPMTLWFSEVGNLDNFYAQRPMSDSDAFSPTIASTGPAFIRWVVPYQEMMVLLTDSGIFSVGFAQTSGFSASSCRITRVSDIQVSPTIQPVVTDAGIVFVGADNKTVFTAAYDIQENMLKPINRSVLVEHLTRTSQIKSIALQSSPDNVVWVVLDNGRYATFTFERNEEVYAWSDGCVDDAEITDVIGLGSVTDSDTDRTYGDLVFVVKKGGTSHICIQGDDYADAIGGTESNVKATLTTLRPESQERTIVGLQKNAKDILIKLYQSSGISVRPTSGDPDIPLVNAAIAADGGLFTGDIKVMPRGLVNENGQMTLVSDNDGPCEILQIVTTMEVSG